MVVIGIIGGVASGKSVVTRSLAELGARVLDADRVGHEVLLDREVRQQVRTRWGDRVFSSQGEIDRSKLAELVFDPERPGELVALERITHPRIEARLRERIREFQRECADAALVLDAPVLVKAGWHVYCQIIVFVDCPRDARLRHAASRGWSEAMFDRREAMQTPIPQKRALATHIIPNDSTLEALQDHVRRFWYDQVVTDHPQSSS